MVNPGIDKPEKSPKELEHLQHVTFEQEKVDTTPLAPFPSPTPTVQGGSSETSKGQLLDFCSSPHSCRICGKLFRSQNAVNAHMRLHKVRKKKARGAFPPSSFTRPDKSSLKSECTGGAASNDPNRRETLQEELSPILLNLAQQVLLALSSSFRPDGSVIDLNKFDPCSLHVEEAGRFDLNKPPPPEDSNDGENIDAGSHPIN